jgi:phosphopantetheinyl transferase
VVPGPTIATLAKRRDGYWLVREQWWAGAADAVVGRYLAAAERDRYAELTPQARREWLLGRIAVKDAVRDWLGDRGAGPLAPADVHVWNEPSGRPRAEAPGGHDLRVSLAHRRAVAVAAVGEGYDVGVDVEVVESRSATFVGLMMRDPERQLGAGWPLDDWVTAVWTAKEAVAKADGTGLRGRPKDWAVEAVDGEWLLVDGRWVHTTREGELVVGTVTNRRPDTG